MRLTNGHDIPGGSLPKAIPHLRPWHETIVRNIGGILAGGVVGNLIGRFAFGSTAPGTVGAFVGMGIMYLVMQGMKKRGLARDSISFYRRLAASEPTNADACVQAGLWIHAAPPSAKTISEGEGFYRRALERSPGHRDATVMLAASLLQSGHPEQAATVLEPWLQSHTDLMGEAIAAEALRDSGRHEDAVKHFRRVLSIQPLSPKKPEILRYFKEHNADVAEFGTDWIGV
jgi:tetratricopeptide (TPR) repeat protein